MKILEVFLPSGEGARRFEAQDFRVEHEIVTPTVAKGSDTLAAVTRITFVGGSGTGHDYAGAVLYPGVFPFLIREKSR